MFDQIQAGTLGGEAYAITLENGGLEIEFNQDYELSDDVLTLADDTIQGIIDGDITIELPEE